MLRVERISAGFQRIVLGGEALDGFTSRGFDDHSKLFFPQPDTHFVPPTVTEEGIVWPEGPRPPSRDYTPLYDELRHELAIDFFIHDGGVASGWAMQAKLRAINLRWQVRAVRWWCQRITRISLYVCDESGMPALRRRLETLSKLAVKPQVSALVSVRDNAPVRIISRTLMVLISNGWHMMSRRVDARLAQMQILPMITSSG